MVVCVCLPLVLLVLALLFSAVVANKDINIRRVASRQQVKNAGGIQVINYTR